MFAGDLRPFKKYRLRQSIWRFPRSNSALLHEVVLHTLEDSFFGGLIFGGQQFEKLLKCLLLFTGQTAGDHHIDVQHQVSPAVAIYVRNTFATEPDVFLLDEPTADLDPAASHAIMLLLRGTADAGRTVVVVLHALDLALRYAHRVVVLADGRATADLPANRALPAAAAAFGLPFGADPTPRLLPPC